MRVTVDRRVLNVTNTRHLAAARLLYHLRTMLIVISMIFYITFVDILSVTL